MACQPALQSAWLHKNVDGLAQVGEGHGVPGNRSINIKSLGRAGLPSCSSLTQILGTSRESTEHRSLHQHVGSVKQGTLGLWRLPFEHIQRRDWLGNENLGVLTSQLPMVCENPSDSPA